MSEITTPDSMTLTDMEQAQVHYLNGKYQESISICTKVLNKTPGNSLAWHLLGIIALKEDNIEDAERFLLFSLTLEPDISTYYYSMSELSWKNKNLENAELWAARGNCIDIFEIDEIIPFDPEINNDELFDLIAGYAETENLKHVLEVGSATGEGSTKAFVRGLAKNPHQPNLYCLEVLPQFFLRLKALYANVHFVKCYNASAVSLADYPDRRQLEDFYKTKKSMFNRYPLNYVFKWLMDEMAVVEQSMAPQNGIRTIKRENNIRHFDLVLLDGSEFTGMAELEEIYGAGIIIMDDVTTYKNYSGRERLLNDPNYRLIKENLDLRNGFSVFKRSDMIVGQG